MNDMYLIVYVHETEEKKKQRDKVGYFGKGDLAIAPNPQHHYQIKKSSC